MAEEESAIDPLVTFLCEVVDDVAQHPALRVEAGTTLLAVFTRQKASAVISRRDRDAAMIRSVKKKLTAIALGGETAYKTHGAAKQVDTLVAARIRAAGAAL